jgi:hypothetical protein
MSEYISSKTRPSNYYIAELGILCSIYNKNKGLLFVVHPKLNKFVQVFQISYRSLDIIFDNVKEIIDSLEKVKSGESIQLLHPCPDFMNDNGKCIFMDKCHEGTRGCTS